MGATMKIEVNDIVSDKKIWVIDIQRKQKIVEMSTAELMVRNIGLDDYLIFVEENNVRRPVIVLDEGDFDVQFENL
jgi:hypothetical protein